MQRVLRLFFRPATLWVPSVWGWSLFFLAVVLPSLGWLRWGEDFLSQNKEVPPEILVVEAWIGPAAIEQAAAEFKRGGYQWVVATAVKEPSGMGFGELDFAASATRVLMENGIPRDRILRLSLAHVPTNRTFTAMAAVRDELKRRALAPRFLTVFTIGPHARRSRMTLQRILPEAEVGSISWLRADREVKYWWHSTERAKDFWDESALFFLQPLIAK